MKFSGGSVNNYMQGLSQLSTPLNSQRTLPIDATTKGLDGGHQN